jgi:hypothetical protein
MPDQQHKPLAGVVRGFQSGRWILRRLFPSVEYVKQRKAAYRLLMLWQAVMMPITESGREFLSGFRCDPDVRPLARLLGQPYRNSRHMKRWII